MNRLLIEAFIEAGGGWSADRVIADPELNHQFILACRQRGLDAPAVQLNLTLLNVRKRGILPRGARRTILRNRDAYAFAAEIAIRCLERRYQTTLDRVLCEPQLAREFDSVAAAVSPGNRPIEYRWAALGLRKTSKLKPEILGRAIRADVHGPYSVIGLNIDEVPRQQGVYILTAPDKVLYVGEAQDLRKRLTKHLDHSDNKFLARYIWELGEAGLFVEYHVLPQDTRTDVRKAMELELIRSRQAEFNVQR